MTREELANAINGLATGENAEAVANVRSEVDALYTTIDAANKLHNDDQKKIASLNDANMKLFLRVTGSPGSPEPDPEPEQTLDDFVKTLAQKG